MLLEVNYADPLRMYADFIVSQKDYSIKKKSEQKCIKDTGIP